MKLGLEMGKNNLEIVISELNSEDFIVRYLKNQRKIGFYAALIGLSLIVGGFLTFFYFPNLTYFGGILITFGFFKCVIYFSNYFVMKTKLSINTELFRLDKNSYLLEQRFKSKSTFNLYKKLIIIYSLGILVITYFLVAYSIPINFKHALLGVLVHAILAMVIYFCEFCNAKTVLNSDPNS
jgi:hypothetical protein